MYGGFVAWEQGAAADGHDSIAVQVKEGGNAREAKGGVAIRKKRRRKWNEGEGKEEGGGGRREGEGGEGGEIKEE